MKPMDFWRLADELSVLDASILITGNNPEESVPTYDEFAAPILDEYGRHVARKRLDYVGFEATFSALKNAIISNNLRANIFLLARAAPYKTIHVFRGETHKSDSYIDGGETLLEFKQFIRLNGARFLHKSKLSLSKVEQIIFLEEPDWSRTTVDVEDLKAWLLGRGVRPPFFFPSSYVEGFRNPDHPRYSAKLACAVEAWENVKKPSKNKSVKQTLEKWVEVNATRFGVANAEGLPPRKAVEEIAAVANWQTSGGATPTYTQDDDEVEGAEATDIQNFDIWYDDTGENPF